MTTADMWVVGIILAILTGAFAARKGYSFLLWCLSGGVIGLIVLACLPFATYGHDGLSDDRIRRRKVAGNVLGLIVSILAASGLTILWDSVFAPSSG